MNVDAAALQHRVESALARTPKLQNVATQMYQTPRIMRALQSAKNEAHHFKDEYIGTEHLFIAATQEQTGDAPTSFREFGIDREKVYQALLKVRGNQ